MQRVAARSGLPLSPCSGPELETTDITIELRRFSAGDREAAERVFPLIYPRLVEMARAQLSKQSRDHTLPPQSLVSEAYLKLVNAEDLGPISDRQHFFCLAARAMRQVLVDYARWRGRGKRLPQGQRLHEQVLAGFIDRNAGIDLVELDDAMGMLMKADTTALEVVELRFFAGMGTAEAADALGIPRGQAHRKWVFAQAFLRSRLDCEPA